MEKSLKQLKQEELDRQIDVLSVCDDPHYYGSGIYGAYGEFHQHIVDGINDDSVALEEFESQLPF